MLKPKEKSERMFLISSEKEMFDTLIKEDHPFRKLNEIINWEEIIKPFEKCYSETGAAAIDLEKGIKSLLIQFWEDYSDRQIEKALQENIAVRWFCGFGIIEQIPKYTYFSKLRARIGTKNIADLFTNINKKLEEFGLFGNVFTFIDASAIITKTALWEERDKALKDGAEKLNNLNVENYAADKDARFGAKSKNKIWYGYKRHEAVDMRYGLVKKVATTPANVLDHKVTKNIAPKEGTVFMDKGYDTKKTQEVLKAKGLHPSTIMKNNNSEKNRDLDRWRSKIRMPFEGTFSKRRRRAKFRGQVKVLMQCFFEAIVHNLKKAVRILPTTIPV